MKSPTAERFVSQGEKGTVDPVKVFLGQQSGGTLSLHHQVQ